MAPKKAPEGKKDAKKNDESKPEDDKEKNKPDDAKKKPDDAKPDDKGEKKKLLEKIKDFFKSTMGMYVTAVVTLIIFTLAIGCIIACLNEWNRTADLRYAMYLVKRFMISRDPSYEKKRAEIQYKLNHDWMAHKNALYTFNKGGRNLKEAIDFCKSEKATMVKIENKAEMEFVQSNVRSSFNTYWLGAYKYSKDWIWTADNTKVTTFYWASGKPGMTETPSTAKPHCLTHKKYCGPPHNCWMDEPCSEKRRVCCKIKPLKKWMD